MTSIHRSNAIGCLDGATANLRDASGKPVDHAKILLAAGQLQATAAVAQAILDVAEAIRGDGEQRG